MASAGDRTLLDSHFRAVVDSSDDAILTKDPKGVITSWNRGAERIYGYAAEEAVGRPISILIPKHRSGEELEILRRVFAGERIEHYETDRVTKDGRSIVVSLTVSAVVDGAGNRVGASVIARDITEQRRSLEQADNLHRLTSLLSQQLTPDQAINVLLDEAVPALGADAGALGLVDSPSGSILLAGSRGYSNQELEAFARFPLGADLPMSDVVRRGEPAWFETAAELAERHPTLSTGQFRFGSLAVVPLIVGGVGLGAVALSFKHAHQFNAQERAFVMATAQQAAYTLERTKLFEAERNLRESLSFLARASELLAESLDVDRTLEQLAFLAVPRVADWCAVHQLDEQDELQIVALAHVDPEKVEFAQEFQRRYPPDPDATTGAANVVRTGEPELYEEIPAELLEEAAQDEEHLAAILELGLVSAMTVPLQARGRTFGALTLVAAESGRRYNAEDLELAMDLARRAAMAIDNAAIYRREHDAAVTLQRALLPRVLPAVEGLAIASRYQPAEAAFEVGGDWYDVARGDDENLTITVGDVAGHGTRSASVMGQLRIALRAFVSDGHAPDASMHRLNRLLLGFDEPPMATILQAALNPSSLELSFVRAGHPPALLRRADGSVEQLDGSTSPPLGLFDDASFECSELQLRPGDTLLLYTDGLIERRGEPIDQGIDRLRNALTAAPAEPEGCLDAVFVAAQAGGEDDVAALALHVRDN